MKNELRPTINGRTICVLLFLSLLVAALVLLLPRVTSASPEPWIIASLIFGVRFLV